MLMTAEQIAEAHKPENIMEGKITRAHLQILERELNSIALNQHLSSKRAYEAHHAGRAADANFYNRQELTLLQMQIGFEKALKILGFRADEYKRLDGTPYFVIRHR